MVLSRMEINTAATCYDAVAGLWSDNGVFEFHVVFKFLNKKKPLNFLRGFAFV